MRIIYRKCKFIGYSTFNASRGPMKELYFVCEDATGFKNQHGDRPVIDKMLDEKYERLIAYKCQGGLMLGNYYDLVCKDFDNDHILHIRTIFPHVENQNEKIPEFNVNVNDSGEDDLTF